MTRLITIKAGQTSNKGYMEEKKYKLSKKKNQYVMTDAKDIWDKIEQGKL